MELGQSLEAVPARVVAGKAAEDAASLAPQRERRKRNGRSLVLVDSQCMATIPQSKQSPGWLSCKAFSARCFGATTNCKASCAMVEAVARMLR